MEVTTKQIAVQLNCTPQAVNKWIRRLCNDRNIDPATFGRLKPGDKRVRVFNQSEVELILKYAPVSETELETVSRNSETILEPDEVIPPAPGSLIIRPSRAIMGFAPTTLNLSITIQNTGNLETETETFQKQSGNALAILKQLTTMEIKNDIQEMRAQNKHAIAGIQAVSLSDAVSDLLNSSDNSAIPENQPTSNQM